MGGIEIVKNMAKSLIVLLCCIIFVFALASCNPPSNKSISLNYIYVDYVDSISFEFDDDFKIKNVYAHNQEATNILSQLPINEASSIESVISQLLTIFAQNEYFLQDTKILFSSSATAIAQKALSHVSVLFEEFINCNDYSVSALYQVVDFKDEQLLNLSTTENVSAGRVAYIYGQNVALTYDQAVLGAKEDQFLTKLDNYVKVSNLYKDYFLFKIKDDALMSEYDAKQIIVNDLEKKELSGHYTIEKIQMDVVGDKVVWSIEIKNNGDFYLFDIDAITGDILRSETRVHSSGIALTTEKTSEEALVTVLNHANLTFDRLNYYDVKVEKDSTNNAYFLIKMRTDFSIFEYKIDATNLNVLFSDYRSHAIRDIFSTYGVITETKAIEIAKLNALVSNVSKLTVQFAYNGGWLYYVDFYVGTSYYYFEINALSGTIIESKVDGGALEEEEDKIGIIKAKSIAYEMAGMGKVITDDDVTNLNLSAKNIKVDGELTSVYDVSFVYNEYSYWYRINAFDGIVIDYNSVRVENQETPVMTEKEAVDIVLNKLNLQNQNVITTCTYQQSQGRDSAIYIVVILYQEVTYQVELDLTTNCITNYIKSN